MSVRLADPALSRIVLIGTPTHVHADERLPDVPVVANNLTDLAAVFTDPKLGGFDARHCVTATPGAGMPEIGEILTDAAENAKDLLLIYYAGHGLLDRRGHLHLALAGTHRAKSSRHGDGEHARRRNADQVGPAGVGGKHRDSFSGMGG